MRKLIFLTTCFCILLPFLVISKEASNHLCNLRGYEIIFPYEEAITKIKSKFKNFPNQKESELEKFKLSFEQNFQGIPLYKEAGCSNARLSEYLNCLITTDGKDCRIYYTQMRIVD